MKNLHQLACLLSACVLSGVTYASDEQNMVGTWVGTANVAVLGVNPHHNAANPKEVRFAKTEFTFVIDKQSGQNFSGYRFSKNGFPDEFVGAMRSDMQSGVISDSDGTREFRMVGKDLMDSCYTHTISANGRSTVAECNELKRQ